MCSSVTPDPGKIVCDGCGLGTTTEHIANRLRRLELTTRYRPIHVQVVFLSAQSPSADNAFLYGPTGDFAGEATALLRALKIEFAGRDRESVLNEFQRKGFFLTHVLECVPDEQGIALQQTDALRKRLPAVLRKIRGSLKPKRVAVVSPELEPLLAQLKTAETGAEWLLDGERPFDLSGHAGMSKLTSALGAYDKI